MIPISVLPAFKDAVRAGGYNLLLGSGTSLDSKNGRGDFLRGSGALKEQLCALKSASKNTSLSRIYPLLTDLEKDRELVLPYSKCVAGISLKPLSRFLWRRIFTFNIDDVLESLYSPKTYPKQTLIPLNFDAPFEPTPDRTELQLIHLHGSVQEPKSGFVFSNSEYARIMTSMNPWMHLLAEILATEPFIIAGTSMNEIDLEYYLSHRSAITPRKGRGPSILVEPHPDPVTESDCNRYGLLLVKATFGEFLQWLHEQLPSPPSVADLVVPDTKSLFSVAAEPPQLLRFFTDFKMFHAGEQQMVNTPTPFLYGHQAEQIDLDQHIDIPRIDNGLLLDEVQQRITASGGPRLFLVLDEAGTGKTTVIRRIAHDLVRRGVPVLELHTLFRMDSANAASCLACATSKVVLLVDGLADHASQIADLLRNEPAAKKIVVLASERSYREDFLDISFGDIPHRVLSLQLLTARERQQLIERFRQFGLVGNEQAIKSPITYAEKLKHDPIAVAVCRILNDFRPLTAIIESLWKESPDKYRLPFLCVALSEYCHAAGVRYSILQSIVGPQFSLDEMFTKSVALGLADNSTDPDFVVTLNAIIGEHILKRVAKEDRKLLLTAFDKISTALAPHVNRLAIRAKTPEAKLARRLFDADTIVNPLLQQDAGQLYILANKQWAWNSRYWEQRALLTADTDLDTALKYARHAVAIELHPFTLTTLAKLLFRQMELANVGRQAIFNEAFDSTSRAIQAEESRSRISVHPFMSLFTGTARYIQLGGQITSDQRSAVTAYIADASYRLARDRFLQAAIRKLTDLL